MPQRIRMLIGFGATFHSTQQHLGQIHALNPQYTHNVCNAPHNSQPWNMGRYWWLLIKKKTLTTLLELIYDTFARPVPSSFDSCALWRRWCARDLAWAFKCTFSFMKYYFTKHITTCRQFYRVLWASKIIM